MVVKPEKKKKRNFKKLIIPIYLLIVIILIVIIYVYPTLTGALSKTMTVDYGNLQITDNLTCYIVKDETVYFANASGDVEYYCEEGDMVRKGTTVISIADASGGDSNDYSDYNRVVRKLLSGNSLLSYSDKVTDAEMELRNLKADSTDETEQTMLDFYIKQLAELDADDDEVEIESGLLHGLNDSDPDSSIDVDQTGISDTYEVNGSYIISYKLDGYESVFNPYTMRFLDKTKVEDTEPEVLTLKSGAATAGEPVFKAVYSRKWYAVAWIDYSDLGKYEKDKSISIVLPEGSVSGKVEDIIDNGEDIMLIMAFNDYYKDLASLRKIKTDIITSDYSGLVIDNSYIASEDGVPGVYVVDVSGDTEFTPIKIKATDGSQSLVESGYYTDNVDGELKRVETVNVYDEIKKVD